MKISDSYNVPADLAGLCYYMLDAIALVPRHWTPRNPAGPNEEDVLMMRGCIAERLSDLGIERPA